MERGTLTASLLARKTGLKQPHISNFLRRRRRLSIPALDRVLAALGMSVTELLPASASAPAAAPAMLVPLVTDEVAMERDLLPEGSIRERIALSRELAAYVSRLPALRDRRGDRFLALMVSDEQAAPMEPALRGGGIVVVDRHAPLPMARPATSRFIFAVRHQGAIRYAYLIYDHAMLILRPHRPDAPLYAIPITPPSVPAEFIVGRVVAVQAPC